MPKPAVTLLGLMLAAIAIGWNIWRYPVVWKMVSATTPSVSAGESAPVSTEPAKPSAKPALKASHAKAARAALPAAIASAKPVPDVPKTVIPDRAATKVESLLTSVIDEKQLRPISTIPPSGGYAAPVLQRLPPVDPNEPPPSFDLRTTGGGTIVYPSTGY